MTVRTQGVARRRLGVALDLTVAMGGAALAGVAVLALLVGPMTTQLAFFISIPVIMLMSWFPILIGRSGAGMEIGFDSCVLIFLASVTAPFEALAIWAVGVALGLAATDQRPAIKRFNVGLGVIAGGLAIYVMDLTRGAEATTPRELLAAGAGAAVYFLVDYVVSGVSLGLEERISVARQLFQRDAITALATFLAISSLGYLGALVVGNLPPWAAVLLAVPVATILFAARARSRGDEHARRLRILLATATGVQKMMEPPAVRAALLAGARDLLRDRRFQLRSEPPEPSEVGVQVHVDGAHTADVADQLWIVGPALDRARSTAGDDERGLRALVAVAEDAFERLRLGSAMAHLAWHDSLTGLANRSLFLDRVEHALAVRARRGGRLAVLFCDLDGFKRVNDLHGHAAGDEVLMEVARRITASVREADTVARLGGDEFAVLLEEVSGPEDISRPCQRILQALRDRIEVGGGEEVSISTTIGVATVDTGASADSLLTQADMAMYHAKAQGKNRFATYELSLGDERLQRIELVETLRNAVEDKKLEVYYQPVVDLRSGAVHGVEALVRWRRDGVLVPPDLFIPTAEESGLIVGLGDIVLELVAAGVPKLRAAAGRRISVGINVSAQQLRLEDFAAHVHRSRVAMGDIALILEVTERDFVNNDPYTLAGMTALADADVRFAIDDFGVGFSSIGYLQRLPVQILKIDRSFLERIEDDARSCSLVRSMVVMGEALGLDVVVEGVERASQVSHLTEHAGATIGQGYLYGEPMRLEDMVAMIAAQPPIPSGPPHPVDIGQTRLAAGHREHAAVSAGDDHHTDHHAAGYGRAPGRVPQTVDAG